MRHDRVYVTTDKVAAVMFAALHPSGGSVYVVEPIGELIPDPDCDLPGLSFECERARILSARGVKRRERIMVRRTLGAM
jgi:rifampin ADP-ribosylating transferase